MKDFGAQYRSGAFWVLVAILTTGTVMLFAPFLPAILWAAVLTVLMGPVHRKFRTRFGANASAGFTLLTAIAVVAVPLILVGIMLGAQLNNFAGQLAAPTSPGGASGFTLENLLARLDDIVRPVASNFGSSFSVVEYFAANKAQIGQAASTAAGKLLASTAQDLFMLVVALLTMFFLLRDGDGLRKPLLDMVPLPEDRTLAILKRTEDTIFAVFLSVVVVGILQGLIAGMGFFITGVPNALIWTVASIVFSFIPLLGAPVIYVPIGLLHLSQNHYWQGILVLVLGFGIVSQVDNVVKPWIIGSRVNLHPMAVFFSLLGGIFLFGPIGLMAGPMLLSITLAILEVLRERLGYQESTPA